MAWAKPECERAQLDAAGRVLATGHADPFEEVAAMQVLSNWRSAHSFPLNTFQVGLRDRARRVYRDALVAQRLKRVPSMVAKLRRFQTMALSQMQDIGGCRAVVGSVRSVRQLREAFMRSGMKHRLVREKDYIAIPKESGYRSVHLVYRYYSDRAPTYNGLQIEMQLRSRMQHAWATAVETVGTLLDRALKSSVGPEEWLRFFSHVGSAFALVERTPLVPNTPTTVSALRAEIRKMSATLQPEAKLRAFAAALHVGEESRYSDSHYFLLALNPQAGTLEIRGYRKNELPIATDRYLAVERELVNVPGGQAVLVAADSMQALRKAYPNYYLDTDVFVGFLQDFIS